MQRDRRMLRTAQHSLAGEVAVVLSLSGRTGKARNLPARCRIFTRQEVGHTVLLTASRFPVPAEPALLAIQLEGEGIQLGKISAGTVCRYVDAFRLGLQAMIEIVESVKTPPTAGRRKRWVERMADLPLLGIESGCVRILLGAPSQNGLFAEAEQESFAKAIDLMFHSLASATAQDDVPPTDIGVALSPAAELRLLGIVAKLMPPKRGPLKRITFLRHAGEGDRPESITLDRRSRDRLEAQLNPEPVDEPHANRFSPAQRDGNHLWSGPA